MTRPTLGPLNRTDPVSPSVQGWVLPYLIRWVEAQGADISTIQQLPGMADLSDPDVRVPEASVDAAWRLAATLTDDVAIGIHLAEWLPRGALDLVECRVPVERRSLAAALERLVRYGRVVSDRIAVRLDASPDRLVLQVRDTRSTPLHPGRAEFALAIVLELARDSAGRNIVPQQVCLCASGTSRGIGVPSVLSMRCRIWRGHDLDDPQRGRCGVPAVRAVSSFARRGPVVFG